MTDDQITSDRSAFMQEVASKREAAYQEGFDAGAKEAYAEGRNDEREAMAAEVALTDEQIQDVFDSVANDDPEVHFRFARAILAAQVTA